MLEILRNRRSVRKFEDRPIEPEKIELLTEALVLSAIGGLAGVVLGALVTAGYASSQGWDIVLPPVALAGGFVAALVIGAVAGLYPATRAARLSPTEALRSG